MKKNNSIFTLLAFSLLITDANSQNAVDNVEIAKSINIDKLADRNNKISGESVKKSIDEIFSPSKLISLMYNDEQFSNIEKAIEAARNNVEFVPEGEEAKKLSEEEAKKQKEEVEDLQKNEENAKSYIYLSSIMFFSEKSWSLWINDKKFVASTNNPDSELFFKDVSQDKVTVIWKLPTPSIVIIVPVILEIAVLGKHVTDPDIVAIAGLVDKYVIEGPDGAVSVLLVTIG